MHFIFIAVNYNGAIHTQNYLASIRALTRGPDDVVQTIIVDNKSASDDLEQVRNFISETHNETLLARDTNDGYFKGLNAGMQSCPKNNQVLIIAGNNDLLFKSDFIEKLKKIQLDPDIQVIAPNIVTLDGRQQNPHVLSKVSEIEKLKTRIYMCNYYVTQVFRFIIRVLKLIKPKSKKAVLRVEYGEIRIKRGIGACYVFTPAFFKVNEQLDDRVFLWGEEALLSHQVESSGGATLYAPSLNITHCESASVKFIESRNKYEIVKRSYAVYREYL